MQDAKSCFVPKGIRKDIFVAIISDGAGSAALGGEGASLICRSLGVAVRRYFKAEKELPSDAEIESWVDSVRDLIYTVAERRVAMPRDFAATLVIVISDGNSAIIGHIGDGCAVLKDESLNKWVAPLWPEHGEYASTTTFLTDDPAPTIRVRRYAGAVSALVLFTDGLERLALDFVSRQPFERFFEGVCRPLFENAIVGRDHALSEELKRYLNSDLINARTDDDKTLVLAVKK